MLKIAVFASGGGTNLQSIIDACKENKINGKIEIVFSNRKSAYALTRAKENNIKTLYLNIKEFENSKQYDKKLLEEIQKHNIDIIVLAGYLRIITKEFIQGFKKPIVNIHPSLIPSFCGEGYYGENVHKAVIESGVKISGATTHFVDENVDTGHIIMQKSVVVKPFDKVETLAKRVLKVEHEILVETVKAFCDNKIAFIEDEYGKRAYIKNGEE